MRSRQVLRLGIALRNVHGQWKRATKMHSYSTHQPHFKGLTFSFVVYEFCCAMKMESNKVSVFEQVKGLPFNRYSWLTTHNSFALLGQKSKTHSVILAPTNQQDTITSQLNVGSVLLLHFFFHFF